MASFILSEDSEKVLIELKRKEQRDVNCLSDSDRGKRKSSLKKYQTMFFGAKAKDIPARDVSRAFFNTMLRSPLLGLLKDDVEACREGCLVLICDFAVKVLDANDLVELLNAFIPSVLPRVGSHPFVETAEEIRLLIAQLLSVLLKAPGCAKVIPDHLDDITAIMVSLLKDLFPKVKQEISSTVIILCEAAPTIVHMSLTKLAMALMDAMVHQHSAVRSAMLTALMHLIPYGSDGLEKLMRESVVPTLATLVFDRTGSVRKLLLQVIAHWMKTLSRRSLYEASLLSILLLGMGDESPEIAAIALALMEDVSASTAAEHPAGLDTKMLPEGALKLPSPFVTRPSLAARHLVVKNLSGIVLPALKDLGDWTVRSRKSSAALMQKVAVFAEDDITAMLDSIIPALCRAARDEDADVKVYIFDTAKLIGCFVETDALLALLLPLVRGEVMGSDTSANRTSALAVLSASVRGMHNEAIAPQLQKVADAMAQASLCESDSKELQSELVSLCLSMVTTSATIFNPDTLPAKLAHTLLRVLVQLAGASDNVFAVEKGMLGIQGLSKLCGFESTSQLFDIYFEGILREILPGYVEWRKSSPRRLCFDTLLRVSGPVSGRHLSLTLPVFKELLLPSRDPDLRLSLLALLETLLGRDELHESFKPAADSILSEILIPNAVWRVGRVAATIRKVAVACQFTLLKSQIATADRILPVMKEWQPILISCLDDDDVSTKHISCMLCFHLFRTLEGTLSFGEVSDLYHPLLKLLDDSDDKVIIAVCIAMVPFYKVAPVECYSGTVLEYSLDTLFIHLDDSNDKIQDAVLEVISSMIPLNSALVLKLAQRERSKHRNPIRCDKLIELVDMS